MGVGAQAEPYIGIPLQRATIGVYGTVAANTLAGARYFSGGLFTDISLCRRGRERCPVALSLEAGVGTTVRPNPSGGPSLGHKAPLMGGWRFRRYRARVPATRP